MRVDRSSSVTGTRHYHLHVPPADAVQVEEHVQVAAQLSKAVYRRAKRFDGAFWEISSSNILEQRADEEPQPAVLICDLILFSQGDYLLVYLRKRRHNTKTDPVNSTSLICT